MAQRQDDSFKLQRFGGMLPAWDNHLLPDGQAVSSTNGYLLSGALESWRVPKQLRQTTRPNPGFIYRVPRTTSARATALLAVLDVPLEGDQVTLGEEVYTFTATVKVAYDVLIGATAADSVTHLFNAFTHDDGAGTNAGTFYGTGTVANPAVDQSGPPTKNSVATDVPRITVVAPDVGSAYNSTAVGENTGGVRLLWTYNGDPTPTLRGGANVALETDITGDSVWLEFDDPDTDVVRSPVVDDQYDRFYFASTSQPPQYNTRARIEAGLPSWLLGVPAPGCTPGVDVTGGGSNTTIGFVDSTSLANAAPGANTIYLIPVTPPGAMILDDIVAVPQGTSTTAAFAGVLYDDLNGSPHTLLSTGTVVKSLTAGTPVTSVFTNPPGLLMNVQYWIGFMVNEAIPFQYADDTGSSGVVSLNTFSNGPPAAIQQLSTGYGDLQVYADLTTSSVLEARSYVYTYVTEYGEESPPSPAGTVANGWSNGTWTVSLFTPPPDQMGVTRDIKTIRIYRTVTASGGTTTYYFVAEVPVTQATYVDTITDDVVAANNLLQSQLWTPPPEGLQGIVAMPNGVLAGWKGNEVWFCEPYRPHAWPPSYVLTTEYPIVGLGVTGNAVVAATIGAPYIATGVSPASMTAQKTDQSEPCHSRRSILGTTDAVYYCSRNGLISVSQYGQVTNLTESWITREKWQQLTPQANVSAVFLASFYFGWEIAPNGSEGSLGARGFTVALDPTDKNSFGVLPQPGGHRGGFQLMTNALPYGVANIAIDHWSAVCTVIARNALYYYDFSDPAPTLAVLDWTSKYYQQRTKKNFEAMRIKFTIPPNTPALNPERKEDPTSDPSWLAPLPQDRYGYILVYADNTLVTAREIRVPQEILRILSGFKHETWHFRIVARVKIANVQVGTSVKGLANV